MIIRQVEEKDLNQLITLENKGFTSEEAASKDAFITRINTIPDTFIIAQENEEIIGYVNGPVIQLRLLRMICLKKRFRTLRQAVIKAF